MHNAQQILSVFSVTFLLKLKRKHIAASPPPPTAPSYLCSQLSEAVLTEDQWEKRSPNLRTFKSGLLRYNLHILK